MSTHSEISARIQHETARRKTLAAAAREASVEVGALRRSSPGFCELSYIVGAMDEAAARFDART